VLVLDEIFAVGDAGFRAKCEERYRALRAAGHTVVLVSHAPPVIEGFCSRAVLLENGGVELSGSPGDVIRAYLSGLTPVS